MAALAEAERKLVRDDYMVELSGRREQLALTKLDLRAALDAVDDWIELNAASYNLAIPQPARSALTAKQKAELLLAVIRKRFEVQ